MANLFKFFFSPRLLTSKRSSHATQETFSHWCNHGDPESSRWKGPGRTGDCERLFPQLGLCRSTQSSPRRMGHGNLVQVCEVRAYLSDTHAAGDKCISLYKQPNATNTAAGHPGSSTFGPSYQRKPANTHACGHTSDHPHSRSETAVTIVNSPLNLGPLYLKYILEEASVWIWCQV